MKQENKVSALTRRLDAVITHPLRKMVKGKIGPIWIFTLSIFLFSGAFYASFNLLTQCPLVPIALLALYFVLLRLANTLSIDQTSAYFDLIYHSLNGIVYGLLSIIAFQYFSLSKWYLFAAIIFFVYVLSAFFYYHRFKTNSYPETIAGLSDVFIVFIITLFVSNYPPILELMQAPIVVTFNLIDLALLFLLIAMIIQTARLVRGVPHITYGIWLFFIGLLIIGIFGYFLFSPLQLAVTMALYGGWYISKLNVATLADGVERSTGLFTPIMVVVSYFMESFSATNTFIIITAYMLFSLVLLLYKSKKAIKKH